MNKHIGDNRKQDPGIRHKLLSAINDLQNTRTLGPDCSLGEEGILDGAAFLCIALQIAFHPADSDELRGNHPSGSGEERLGEVLGGCGGYGSGLEE